MKAMRWRERGGCEKDCEGGRLSDAVDLREGPAIGSTSRRERRKETSAGACARQPPRLNHRAGGTGCNEEGKKE